MPVWRPAVPPLRRRQTAYSAVPRAPRRNPDHARHPLALEGPVCLRQLALQHPLEVGLGRNQTFAQDPVHLPRIWSGRGEVVARYRAGEVNDPPREVRRPTDLVLAGSDEEFTRLWPGWKIASRVRAARGATGRGPAAGQKPGEGGGAATLHREPGSFPSTRTMPGIPSASRVLFTLVRPDSTISANSAVRASTRSRSRS